MDCSTYVLGPNSQLLHYETSPIHPRTNRIKLPKSILEGAKNLSIRTDLENVGIDICSNEVRLIPIRITLFFNEIRD